VNAWGSWEEIRRNWEENFSQTAGYIGRSIETSTHEPIQQWVNRQIEELRPLIEERVRLGRIVDGHGDLRCESVCVLNGICFFDCIEFNDRFRCCDVASEAAFLAMDLDMRGRPDLSYYFTEQYNFGAKDPELFRLLPFYRCYRAYVRGKVLSFRLDQAGVGAAEKKRSAERAAAYFELARRYASPLPRPALVVVSGLSGTGKTTVARAIASELGLRVVSADAVRQELFGEEKKPAAYGEGAYRPEATRKTYETMMGRGRELLSAGGGAVLDGVFLGDYQEGWAAELAASAGAPLRWIECRLADEAVRQRIEERHERGDGQSDATWEIYLRQREERGTLGERSIDDRLLLDTGRPLPDCSRAATDWLRESLLA
jgi:hypothetical protein